MRLLFPFVVLLAACKPPIELDDSSPTDSTPTDDTGTPTDDTGGESDHTGTPADDKDPGCGCQTGGSAGSLAGLGLLLLAVSRRPMNRERSARDRPSSLPTARGMGRRSAGG